MAMIERVVSDLWDEFDRQLHVLGFAADDAAVVLLHLPRHASRLLQGLVGYWNGHVADWATIGPRMVGPRFEQGTLQKIGKRTFLTACPVASEVEITINKRDGKAGAEAVVTLHRRDGSTKRVRTVTFPEGKGTQTRTVRVNEGMGILSIEMDAKMDAWKVDTFAYSIKVVETPDTSFTARASGFADLHLHQMAEAAFLGKWLHGSHAGAQGVALEACTGRDHALPGAVWNTLMGGAHASKVFHGKGYPTYEDWPHHLDMGHQQAHESWLQAAHDQGLNLIVSCAVSNEPLALLMGLTKPADVLTTAFRDMPVLERQIDMIHAFARNHPWYEVALNPWHARRIIAEHKLAVVISVESSNLFPPDGGDVVDQLDRLYAKGVRCIQIAHEVDSRFAGAAPQEHLLQALQTAKNLTQGTRRWGMSLDAHGNNELGLTDDGRALVRAIMDRHMCLDVAHLSARALRDVFEIAMGRDGYPLINSHTKFEDVLTREERAVQREFVTRKDQIECYAKTGGIVGLRTAPWTNRQARRSGDVAVETDTGEIGTARSFAQQVIYAHDHNVTAAFGTDINGFTNQLGPRSGTDGKKPRTVDTEYWKHGLKHIGMLPGLAADLEALGTPGAAALADSAESFLRSWQRTWERDPVTAARPSTGVTAVPKPAGTGAVRAKPASTGTGAVRAVKAQGAKRTV